MKLEYYYYGIDKKLDKEIIKDILYKNDRFTIPLFFNSKPFNLPEFYNQLDEDQKKYCIQSFTCFDTECKKLISLNSHIINLSVCTEINKLRVLHELNEETFKSSKKNLDIIELSKDYTNIYSWLDSLEINDLYKYFQYLLDDIDVTFSDNYYWVV